MPILIAVLTRFCVHEVKTDRKPEHEDKNQ